MMICGMTTLFLPGFTLALGFSRRKETSRHLVSLQRSRRLCTAKAQGLGLWFRTKETVRLEAVRTVHGRSTA